MSRQTMTRRFTVNEYYRMGRLDEGSEPEPDIAVVRPRSPGFPPSHPTPDDVLLLIEVADTSFDFDLRTKIPLYARHGIPEVWLVNLTRETIIIHRDPAPDGYRTIEVRRRGDHVSPSAFPDQQFAVDEILD